ncbi:hypothetical protein DL89DRAFT_269037 [Linderina pennispora]|uniref:Uncharacterized protein n=1 Tax=Linderina pennispora TaxID=61395 RepID=A0A1Y1W3V5_9FUNG|nr:uncharacterized protein DL89DRAFT_269037 [Linderina pennispora]ORX67854.1 hypothetical protein DL89DRAFT_269037 [Linderina pennispora]
MSLLAAWIASISYWMCPSNQSGEHAAIDIFRPVSGNYSLLCEHRSVPDSMSPKGTQKNHCHSTLVDDKRRLNGAKGNCRLGSLK